MPRFLLVALASIALVATALGGSVRPAVAADCGPGPSVSAAAGVALEAPGRSAGTIEGKVSEIDYRGSRMTVTAGKRCYDILVQPSTSIVGKGKDFYEIADIKRGARVEVLLSEKAGAYIAQIIHLL
jgi:hypothetical protein